MGILDRELIYYKSLASKIRKLSIVSSGDRKEVKVISKKEKIEVLFNRWKLPANIYSLCAPFLHYSSLSSGNLYKTNQLDGAWTAVISGFIYKKIVILRAGYLWAEFAQKEGSGKFKINIIRFLQWFSLKSSEYVYLPTISDKSYISQKYQIAPQNIYVIPNYVDTDLFKPLTTINKIPRSIIYIGRLHPRKNLISLVEACLKLKDVQLILIGDGPQLHELERIVQENKLKVTFLGVMPHNQIPAELNRADLFVLPSLFEGHPKALIEAMACGMPVIGSNVQGIREIIQHGKTGWLCGTDPDSLAETINYVFESKELKKKMGKNAREFVLENYSLEKVLKMELEAIQSILDLQ